MNRNEKSEMISEIKELFESSSAVYLTDYQGINVSGNVMQNFFRKAKR